MHFICFDHVYIPLHKVLAKISAKISCYRIRLDTPLFSKAFLGIPGKIWKWAEIKHCSLAFLLPLRLLEARDFQSESYKNDLFHHTPSLFDLLSNFDTFLKQWFIACVCRGSDQSHSDSGDNDSNNSNLKERKDTWGKIGNFLQVQLPSNQTTMVPFEKGMTVNDLVLKSCDKRLLEAVDHFLMLLSEDNESGLIGDSIDLQICTLWSYSQLSSLQFSIQWKITDWIILYLGDFFLKCSNDFIRKLSVKDDHIFLAQISCKLFIYCPVEKLVDMIPRD